VPSLSYFQPNIGTFASTNATNGLFGNATFRANGTTAGLPANFWVMNPDVQAAKQEVEAAPKSVPTGLIEELEAKVAEAEARAKEAEEEALRITPEANDLRAKLAQAAARKKLGSSS